MRPALAATLLCFAGSCCFQATGAASTGGGSTSAGGGSTSAATSGTASGGGATAGSTGASSSGGSSAGLPYCAQGAIWVGNVCTRLDCASAPLYESCLLSDGGIGFCAAGACQGIDLSSDPNDCGEWGVPCPNGTTCIGHSCSAPCGDGFTCPDGRSCNSGECFATSCSPAENDEVCFISTGVYGICCDGNCLTQASPSGDHCGACGVSCGDAGYCVAASCNAGADCATADDNAPCRIPGDATRPGFCCHGACQDPKTDSQECRACGQSCTACGRDGGCGPGEACSIQGYCAPVSCAGAPDGQACSLPSLLDPDNDSLQWTYGPETIRSECCAGGCTDLDSDSANCGSCGDACPTGFTCQWGQCTPAVDCASAVNGASCALGPGRGQGACCGGRCTDTTQDPVNCGRCGSSCAPGDTCTGFGGGTCARPDGGTEGAPYAACDEAGTAGDWCLVDGGLGECCASQCLSPGTLSACVSCGQQCPPCGTGCPTGMACVNYNFEGTVPLDYCLPLSCNGETNGGPCAFGPFAIGAAGAASAAGPGGGSPSLVSDTLIRTRCCSDACVDVFQDPNNCGECGVICASGICSGASCVLAASTDDCGESCAPGTICAAGSCVDSSCDEGSSYCLARDGNIGACCGYGVCSDLLNDPHSCGGCGLPCPPGATCSGGACSSGNPGCLTGRFGAFCNLDAGPSFVCCANAGCTDLETDPSNCGACGTTCPKGTCSAGACQ